MQLGGEFQTQSSSVQKPFDNASRPGVCTDSAREKGATNTKFLPVPGGERDDAHCFEWCHHRKFSNRPGRRKRCVFVVFECFFEGGYPRGGLGHSRHPSAPSAAACIDVYIGCGVRLDLLAGRHRKIMFSHHCLLELGMCVSGRIPEAVFVQGTVLSVLAIRGPLEYGIDQGRFFSNRGPVQSKAVGRRGP